MSELKRYDCYGLDDLGGSYSALSEQCSDGDWCKYEDVADLSLRIAVADKEVRQLKELLEAGKRAIGDHYAPDDCYATGPLTGNKYLDLVQCPACAFIKMFDEYKESLHEFIKNNPQYGEK